MIFKYPYTDLYNLNLDWVIQAIKEVQETITNLGAVVNTFNGQSGDVTLSAADITSIVGDIVNSINGRSGDVTLSAADITTLVGGIVNSFNGRSGAVTLTEADVNATLIDIVWTSDPGEVIGDLSQSALDELFAAGRRVLIFNNALGEPDRIYFLTLVNDTPTPQQYIPTGAIAGVASVNGQTGAVSVRGDTIPVSGTDPTTVEDALAAKEDVLTFDNTPTAGSTNPVTSAGIQAADAAIRTDLATLSNTVSGIDNRLESAEQQIDDLGPYNGLDSDSTIAALAAAQGKVLNNKFFEATSTGVVVSELSDTWLLTAKNGAYRCIGGSATGTMLEGVDSTYGILLIFSAFPNNDQPSVEEYCVLLFCNVYNSMYYRNFNRQKSTSKITWHGPLKKITTT